MSKYLDPDLNSLDEYVPGKQPKLERIIKLNTNESPYPPSPSVFRAMARFDTEKLRLYCDPESYSLRSAIAEYHKKAPENVVVTSGSDDILNFIFKAYGKGGVLFPDITYGFYSIFADQNKVPYQTVPLDGDFKIRISDYEKDSSLVVIANPNAPTGLEIPVSDIEALAAYSENRVIAVDEAYIDFGRESALSLTEKYKNVIVVRTYSKSRALAGARLGYAIADRELIDDIKKLKNCTNPYNVSSLVQVLGEASLEDDDYFRNCCSRIISSREKLKAALSDLGYTVTDSKANFVFAKSPGVSGEKLAEALFQRGILVRHFAKDRISDYVRISIGSENDTEILIKTIGEIENEICGNK